LKSVWFPGGGLNPRARLRLFCFHHAGGGASSFRAWPGLLPTSIEVVSCHLPGHEERFREAPLLSIDELVDDIISEIRQLLDIPFAFFGHSFGAMVAFYLARGLRTNGLDLPQRLIVSGCRPPHLPPTREPIHQLPSEQFIERLQQRYESIPEAILSDPDARDLFASILRADFTILETAVYRPEPPLACAISAYAGWDDEHVPSTCLEGWSNHTSSGQTRTALFPGGHFYLRSLPGELIRRLIADLLA
jgi:medium-chain acyl-[acyl-carrier-protein] hydrolase